MQYHHGRGVTNAIEVETRVVLKTTSCNKLSDWASRGWKRQALIQLRVLVKDGANENYQ